MSGGRPSKVGYRSLLPQIGSLRPSDATSADADAFQEAGPPHPPSCRSDRSHRMNNIIYLVGLVVVVIAVLSFFGLR